MFSYGKIFGSMFTGSMVGSGPVVLSLWAYVIANAQPPGVVELNPRLLAYIIGCKVQEIEAAIEVLCGPDKSSRTEDMEGRRLIQEGAMQYRVVTWAKYNKVRNDEARRAQNREAQARYRRKSSLTVSTVSHASAESAHRDGEGDLDADSQVPDSSALRREEKPVDPRFLQFWEAYGRKGSRKQSLAEWVKLKPTDEMAAEVTAKARAYRAAYAADPQYQKDGQRWLKHAGWMDEIVPRSNGIAPKLTASGRVVVEASKMHIPNMPLGSEFCDCPGCAAAKLTRSISDAKNVSNHIRTTP